MIIEGRKDKLLVAIEKAAFDEPLNCLEFLLLAKYDELSYEYRVEHNGFLNPWDVFDSI